MREIRHHTSTLQAITPEEPTRSNHIGENELQEEPLGFAETGAPGGTEDSTFQGRINLEPSLANTRELTLQIVRVIDKLKAAENQKIDIDEVVSVLNQSLTAISHWSLQAQLAQTKSFWDSRLAVENNLIRREAEFFKTKFEQSADSSCGSGAVSKPTPSPSKFGSVKRRPLPLVLNSPTSVKLVEHTKPHPRMRRQKDGPANSGFVRVFHLERL